MQSIDLIRDNLKKSEDRVLSKIDEMREHSLIFPTRNGGSHTLWVLGHLAYIEGLVIQRYMLAKPNPMNHWEEIFDGANSSADAAMYPAFDEVLAKCRAMRKQTLTTLDALSEKDLDKESAHTPPGYEDIFGNYRSCLQYVADHWYMHRGHLADARRSAGLARIWV